MFKSRRTKIVSVPAEEVLEVVAPEPEQTIEPAPEIVTVYNIDQLSVWHQNEVAATGALIDSVGKQYEYVWDKRMKRINSLTGEGIDNLIWMLCDSVLNKYFVKPEQPKQETPVEVKIAEALKVALTPVVGSIKALENKVATTKTVQVPIQQPAPRPQTVQSTPVVDTPAISVADSDISANAMRFLQESTTPDLGIDYMSL